MKKNWFWILLCFLQTLNIVFIEKKIIKGFYWSNYFVAGVFVILSLVMFWFFTKIKIKKISFIQKTSSFVLGIMMIIIIPTALSTITTLTLESFITYAEVKQEKAPKKAYENEQLDGNTKLLIKLTAVRFFTNLRALCLESLENLTNEQITELTHIDQEKLQIELIEIEKINFECGARIKIIYLQKISSEASLAIDASLDSIQFDFETGEHN